MNSVIFHISDTHISNDIGDFIVKCFIDTFNFANYSKAFFIFSGDLALSGKTDQYLFFNSFLSKIRDEVIKNKCEFI